MEFIIYFGAVFEPTAMLLLVGGTIGGLILGARCGPNSRPFSPSF